MPNQNVNKWIRAIKVEIIREVPKLTMKSGSKPVKISLRKDNKIINTTENHNKSIAKSKNCSIIKNDFMLKTILLDQLIQKS